MVVESTFVRRVDYWIALSERVHSVEILPFQQMLDHDLMNVGVLGTFLACLEDNIVKDQELHILAVSPNRQLRRYLINSMK
jgi:hypothetical protein